MRLRLIAAGKSTSDEMFLMVREKVEALEEARAVLLRGGDATQILDNYQKIVAAKRGSPVALEIANLRLPHVDHIVRHTRHRVVGPSRHFAVTRNSDAIGA